MPLLTLDNLRQNEAFGSGSTNSSASFATLNGNHVQTLYDLQGIKAQLKIQRDNIKGKTRHLDSLQNQLRVDKEIEYNKIWDRFDSTSISSTSSNDNMQKKPSSSVTPVEHRGVNQLIQKLENKVKSVSEESKQQIKELVQRLDKKTEEIKHIQFNCDAQVHTSLQSENDAKLQLQRVSSDLKKMESQYEELLHKWRATISQSDNQAKKASHLQNELLKCKEELLAAKDKVAKYEEHSKMIESQILEAQSLTENNLCRLASENQKSRAALKSQQEKQTLVEAQLEKVRIELDETQKLLKDVKSMADEVELKHQQSLRDLRTVTEQRETYENEATQKITNMSSKIDRLTANISSLQNELLKQESELKAQYNTKLDAKTMQCNMLQTKFTSVAAKLSAERDLNKNKLEEVHTELRQLQEDREAESLILEAAHERISQLESNAVETATEIQNLTRNSETYRNTIQSLTSKNKQLENEVTSSKSELSSLEKLIDDSKTELASKHHQLMTANSEINAQTKKLVDIETNLIKELRDSEQRVEEYKIQLEENKVVLANVKSQMVQKEGRISEIEQQMTTKLQEVENQMDAKEKDIVQKNKEIAAIKLDIDEKVTRMSQAEFGLKSELQTLRDRLSETEAQLKLKNERLSTVQCELESKTIRISEIELDVSEFNKERLSLMEDKKNVTTLSKEKIKTLEAQLRKLKSERVELQARNKAKAKKSETVSQRLHSELKSHKEDIERLTKSIKSKDRLLSRRDSDIIELRASASKFRSESEINRQHLEQMNLEFQRLEQHNVASAETRKQYDEVQKVKFSRDIKHLQNQIEGRDLQIKKLMTEVAKLRADKIFNLSQARLNKIQHNNENNSYSVRDDGDVNTESTDIQGTDMSTSQSVEMRHAVLRETQRVSDALKRMSVIERSISTKGSDVSNSSLENIVNLQKCQKMLKTVLSSQKNHLSKLGAINRLSSK